MALALLAREEMIGLIDWKEEKVTVAPPLPKPCRMGRKMKLTS
jgi:hypothetical protein